MNALNATAVRQDWSTVIENVVRDRPQFIKRTRDYLVLADIKLFESLLSAYQFSADMYVEADGSVTMSLDEIDLVENAKSQEAASLLLGKAILEYAEEFYDEFSLWSAAPNRKSHIPYVLKALIINDAKKIGDSIICQAGKI